MRMASLVKFAMGKPTVQSFNPNLINCLKQTDSPLLRSSTIVKAFRYFDHSKSFLPAFHQKYYCTKSDKQPDRSLQQHAQSDLSEDVKPITFKNVKETTKTASYLGVICLGVGVTGIMFYTVFSELFSSKSPNNVYSKALETVIGDPRVQDALGLPLSGYGEENRRGRRQHVSHLLYEKDGEKRLRMKFYVSGSRKRATVHLEMKEDDSGAYMYRYLFVELDDFGRHPIVLEDNRHSTLPKSNNLPELSDLSTPINMNLNFPEAGLK